MGGSLEGDEARLFSVGSSDRTQIEIPEIPLKHENSFCCDGDCIPEQVAPRGCGVSVLGDIKNPTGHGPGQPALVDPTLSRGLDWTVSRDAFEPQLLCHPVNRIVVKATFLRLCTRLVPHLHKQAVDVGVLLPKRQQIVRTT